MLSFQIGAVIRRQNKWRKVDTPLRPIVTLQGCPIYSLAKWLAKHLRPLTLHSPTTVTSAEQLLAKLKITAIQPGEILISFDVTSLTSILKELAEMAVRE